MSQTLLPFAKGQATGNDFVLLGPAVLPGQDLPGELVRHLANRRFGIGGDGVIRAVTRDDQWFMDYYNADGSRAEMCGNGLRLFVVFLAENFEFTGGVIGTVSGDRDTTIHDDGQISVQMDVPTQLADTTPVTWATGSGDAVALAAPNPHAILSVPSVADIGELNVAPKVSAETFPQGANVEFVEQLSADFVLMRVHERGVGETQSCGTGACAVAWHFRGGQDLDTVVVEVPGGTVSVDFTDDQGVDQVWLRGPAQIEFSGEVRLPADVSVGEV